MVKLDRFVTSLTRHQSLVRPARSRYGEVLLRPGANMQNSLNWRLAYWGFAALALIVPLIGMQMTNAVDWSSGDFAAAALLLGGAGLALELATRLVQRPKHRWLAAGAVLLALLLIWAELAVGIFG